MVEAIIYHNPRCSKSRQTLALLEENNVNVTVFKYLESPMTADNIQQILSQLALSPRDIMRTKEAEYKEQGLQDGAKSDTALINAIIQTPKLLERPIVIANGKAAIGRPPENVLAIL